MEISELIPHRAPMLLVDKIIELDVKQKTIVCQKTVLADEFYLQGHYPDFPIVPGVITCEMLFQSGAALISKIMSENSVTLGQKVPVITRSQNIRFKNMVRGGDEVLLKVELLETLGGAYYLKGRASVLGKMVVSVEFTCMLADRV